MLLNNIINFLNATSSIPTSSIPTSSVESTTSEIAETVLSFEPQRFLDMLPYMGKGMLVIFVLIGVIILVTMLINKIFTRKTK